MQKKWVISGLVAAGAIGLWMQHTRKKEIGLSLRDVRNRMEKKGYSVFRTPEKGVFLLVKNHTRSLLLFDHPREGNPPLFQRLNDHEHGYDHELFIVSASTNTLFAKTKTLFFRWYHTQPSPKKPFAVHFSTLPAFLEDQEVVWETTVL